LTDRTLNSFTWLLTFWRLLFGGDFFTKFGFLRQGKSKCAIVCWQLFIKFEVGKK